MDEIRKGDEEEVRLTVAPEDAGERLDRYLAARLGGVTRSRVQRAIREGLVWLDGVAAWKAGLAVREGDEVLFVPSEQVPNEAAPEEIPLSVLYEDAAIAVVDKPAGLVVHPAAGHASGTLVNALLWRYPEMRGGMRPGIVHRLDKGTSGVMVVARTIEAREELADQFLNRKVMKGYLALVLGEPRDDEGVVERPIGRHGTDRKRFTSRDVRGKPAVTLWRKAATDGKVTLLAVRILTGRTHQVRVHLRDDGFPLVGDDAYCPGWRQRLGRPRIAALCEGRPMLHAALLRLRLPGTGEVRTFVSPLPPPYREVLDALYPEAAAGIAAAMGEVRCYPEVEG